MFDLAGHPVLEWCVRACRAAVGVDEVWVATTQNPEDQKIVEWCDNNIVRCLRGPSEDVLARYCMVAEASGGDIFLRVTGDEPFIDPAVISAVVRLQKDSGADYTSNIHPRSFPDGLDVECFTRKALEMANKEATRAIDRDCVTTWMVRHKDRISREAVYCPLPDLENERWVLDTPQDYNLCQALAHTLWWEHGPPSMFDILKILDENPRLRKLNAGAICNERYFEALDKEPEEVKLRLATLLELMDGSNNDAQYVAHVVDELIQLRIEQWGRRNGFE